MTPAAEGEGADPYMAILEANRRHGGGSDGLVSRDHEAFAAVRDALPALAAKKCHWKAAEIGERVGHSAQNVGKVLRRLADEGHVEPLRECDPQVWRIEVDAS